MEAYKSGRISRLMQDPCYGLTVDIGKRLLDVAFNDNRLDAAVVIVRMLDLHRIQVWPMILERCRCTDMMDKLTRAMVIVTPISADYYSMMWSGACKVLMPNLLDVMLNALVDEYVRVRAIGSPARIVSKMLNTQKAEALYGPLVRGLVSMQHPLDNDSMIDILKLLRKRHTAVPI